VSLRAPSAILAILALLVSGLGIGNLSISTAIPPTRSLLPASGGVMFENAWMSLHPAAPNGRPCASPAGHPCLLRPHPASAPASWYWDHLLPGRSPTPACRGDPSLAYDAADSKVILFGGLSGFCGGRNHPSNYNDTWAFRGGNWTNLTSAINVAPSPRWQPGFTYDAADGYILLFGGQTPTGVVLNDTWSFVGGKWTNRTASSAQSPAPRYRPQMTYDASDGYVLLFGGFSTAGFAVPLNDTWRYAALNWSQVNTTGRTTPTARGGGGFTYDAVDAYAVLFGGVDAAIKGRNDTWTYHAGNWTNATTAASPPGRWLPGMAYDGNLSRVVLFGGCFSAGCYGAPNDTWTFVGGSWSNDTKNLTPSPGGRGGISPVDDAVDGWLLLFGGSDNPSPVFYGDTWTFPFGPLQANLTLTPASPDLTGTMIQLNTTVSGTGTALTYTYSGLPAGCASLNASQLSCRPNRAGAFVIQVNVTNASGGRAIASTPLRLIAPIVPATWLNVTSSLGYDPSCRDQTGLVYDAADNYVLLFGGSATNCGNLTLPTSLYFYNDTWAYSKGNWTNISKSLVGGVAPPPRWGSSIGYDAKDGEVVLFGGLDTGFNPINDTWTYSGNSWKQLMKGGSPIPGPSARWRMAMTYDAADQYLLAFGGAGAYCFCSLLNDTWSFVAGAWTELNTGAQRSPTPRLGAEVAYDAFDGYVLLFGGAVGGFVGLSDTWSYVGGSWTQHAPVTSPQGRFVGAIDYDPARKAVMIFGGAIRQGAVNSENDTWAFAGGLWMNLSGNYSVSPGPRAVSSMTYDVADSYSVLFGGANMPSPVQYNDTWLLAGHALFANVAINPAAVDVNQSFVVTTRPVATGSPLSYAYSGLPSGCLTANTSSLRCTPTASGLYHLRINVSDPSGTSISVNRTIQVAPALATPALLVMPTSFDLGGRLYVNATIVGGVSPYSFQYLGVPFGCFGPYVTSNFSCTPTQSGSWNLSVRVTDANGAAQASSAVYVHVFSVITATAKTNVSQVDVNRPVTYSSTVGGGAGGYTYLWSSLPNGCAAGNVSTFTCIPRAVGGFTSGLSVRDANGVTVVAGSLRLVVNPPPQLTIQVGPAQGLVPLSVAINLSETLGTFPYAVRYDFGDGTTLALNGSTAHTYARTGVYTIRVQMADAAGAAAYANATVDAVGPLAVQLTASPTALTSGQLLILTARPLGGSGTYTIQWQGLPVGCTGSNTTVLRCHPTNAGTAFPTVNVRDTLGLASRATATITVYRALSLVSNATLLGGCQAPFAVQLATAVSGGHAPVTVNWSFGDGSGGSTPTVFHNYTSAGSFSAQATARDGDNATANSTVTVVVGPAASCSAKGGLAGLSTWWIVVGVIAAAALLLGVLFLRRRGLRSPPPVDEPAPGEPPTAALEQEPEPMPDDAAPVEPR
jgi:PKD domain/Galactose oxidase, central domain